MKERSAKPRRTHLQAGNQRLGLVRGAYLQAAHHGNLLLREPLVVEGPTGGWGAKGRVSGGAAAQA